MSIRKEYVDVKRIGFYNTPKLYDTVARISGHIGRHRGLYGIGAGVAGATVLDRMHHRKMRRLANAIREEQIMNQTQKMNKVLNNIIQKGPPMHHMGMLGRPTDMRMTDKGLRLNMTYKEPTRLVPDPYRHPIKNIVRSKLSSAKEALLRNKGKIGLGLAGTAAAAGGAMLLRNKLRARKAARERAMQTPNL
jgi:hypothetical protein